MKYNLYSVFDEVTEVFTFPFHAVNEKEAVRTFKNAQLSPNTVYHLNPSDFSLYYLGTYDDTLASFETHNQPLLVVRLSSLIQPVNEEKK